MSFISRIGLLAFVALGAAGCIDPASPISLNLELSADYVQNGDGTCTATVSSLASGIGTATWRRVALTRGSVTEEEWVGAEVVEFWGATSISAGQIQKSAPFSIPATATDYTVLFRYGIAGTDRDVSLRMDCASGG